MENVDTSVLSAVHSEVKLRFVYTSDDVNTTIPKSEKLEWMQGEHWPTRTQAAAKTLYGDCDDFAIACWGELRKRGVKNARLLVCMVPGGGHLVCEVEGWILDNRFPTIQTREELEKYHGYRWISRSGDEPGEPWTLVE